MLDSLQHGLSPRKPPSKSLCGSWHGVPAVGDSMGSVHSSLFPNVSSLPASSILTALPNERRTNRVGICLTLTFIKCLRGTAPVWKRSAWSQGCSSPALWPDSRHRPCSGVVAVSSGGIRQHRWYHLLQSCPAPAHSPVAPRRVRAGSVAEGEVAKGTMGSL